MSIYTWRKIKSKQSNNKHYRNHQGIIMNKVLSAKYNFKEFILENALLPFLENAFRSGLILEISKEIELFKTYLDFKLAMSANNELTTLLMNIGNWYEPPQTEPIYKLLEKLTTLADIFLKGISIKILCNSSWRLNKVKETYWAYQRCKQNYSGFGIECTERWWRADKWYSKT